MDIAKYIALFLVKNHSCFIQGLGGLELVRKPAHYDGQALHAATYEIVFEATGAKDDNLANFIATNESVSISKVFDALHDFSTATKKALDSGQEVSIPAIGKFVQQNGKIRFVANAALLYTPAAIEVTRTETNTTVTPDLITNNEERKSGTWLTGTLIIILLLILTAGGIYMYQMYTDMVNMTTLVPAPTNDTTTQTAPVPLPDTAQHITDTTRHDTTATMPANGPQSTITVVPPTTTMPKPIVRRYEVVLKSYYTIEKAQQEVTKMKEHGYNVRLLTADSLKYLVVMNVRTTTRDTARVLDSLGTLFNPGKVYIR